VLDVEPGTVDVHRLEAAVATAERRRAAGTTAEVEAALAELRVLPGAGGRRAAPARPIPYRR